MRATSPVPVDQGSAGSLLLRARSMGIEAGRRAGLPPSDCEDAGQEVALRLLEFSAERPEAELSHALSRAHASAYARRVVLEVRRRKALDRRRCGMSVLDLLQSLVDPRKAPWELDADPVDATFNCRDELRAWIEANPRVLTAKDAEALLARLEWRSLRAAARAVGISPSALRERLHRASAAIHAVCVDAARRAPPAGPRA